MIEYKEPKDYKKEIIICSGFLAGYLYFYDSSHPLRSGEGCVYCHRHIISLKLGRWINKDEHVHHKDGNKLNNNPENLELTNIHDHPSSHKTSTRVIMICKCCGKEFSCTKRNSPNRSHCSSECQHKMSQRFDISKEELEKLVWEIPTTKIAKQFGVSDAAIAKRCKKFGIKKPGRNHWIRNGNGKAKDKSPGEDNFL